MKRYLVIPNDETCFTIAAALRFWCRADNRDEFPEYDIATNMGDVEPLSPELCDEYATEILQGVNDPAIDVIAKFLNDFSEAIESDEPIAGSEAVDYLVGMWHKLKDLTDIEGKP